LRPGSFVVYKGQPSGIFTPGQLQENTKVVSVTNSTTFIIDKLPTVSGTLTVNCGSNGGNGMLSTLTGQYYGGGGAGTPGNGGQPRQIPGGLGGGGQATWGNTTGGLSGQANTGGGGGAGNSSEFTPFCARGGSGYAYIQLIAK
jgi:hypothetical protein